MSEDSSLADQHGSTKGVTTLPDQAPLPRLRDRTATIPRGKLMIAVMTLGFWIASGWLLSTGGKDNWLPQAAYFDVLTSTGVVALVLVVALLMARPSIRPLPFAGVLLLAWIAVPMVTSSIVSNFDPVFSPRTTGSGRPAAMPTPAVAPEPIPPRILEMSREGSQLFGPGEGSLLHKGRMYMDVQSAGSLTVADFAAEARFYHPQACSTFPWDIGFVFRRDSVHEYAIYIDCVSGWRLSLLDKDMGSWLPIDRGTLRELDVRDGGSNHLKLIAAGVQGYLMVNELHVATLDLSDFRGKGQIDAAVNFSHSNQRPGKSTKFEGFTVWALPEGAAQVAKDARPPEVQGLDAIPSSHSAAGGRILFSRRLPGASNGLHFSVNPDGTGLSALEAPDSQADGASWSPDGRKVAWVKSEGDGSAIFAMNVDGTGKTELTSQKGFKYTPRWSPDSRKVAYVSLPPSALSHNTDIWVVNADGTGETRLTTDPAEDESPAWSPDARRIVFQSNRGGSNDIYIMDADGKNQKRVTSDPAVDLAPVWSPGGDTLAFASDRSGRYHIYTMRLDGTGLTRLTESSRGGLYPAWSPDGKMIAFSGLVSGGDPPGLGYSVFVIEATGGAPLRLTTGRSMDILSSWIK